MLEICPCPCPCQGEICQSEVVLQDLSVRCQDFEVRICHKKMSGFVTLLFMINSISFLFKQEKRDLNP